MLQKALPITYPHLGKSTLPNLSLISEFPLETVGEPTLDQLHGLFDGRVARQRSDCNKRRAMLVFVVTKKPRALLRIVFGQAFRAGCAITGAKAQIFLQSFYGPTKVVP